MLAIRSSLTTIIGLSRTGKLEFKFRLWPTQRYCARHLVKSHSKCNLSELFIFVFTLQIPEQAQLSQAEHSPAYLVEL
jgi:hypothetical protein